MQRKETIFYFLNFSFSFSYPNRKEVQNTCCSGSCTYLAQAQSFSLVFLKTAVFSVSQLQETGRTELLILVYQLLVIAFQCTFLVTRMLIIKQITANVILPFLLRFVNMVLHNIIFSLATLYTQNNCILFRKFSSYSGECFMKMAETSTWTLQVLGLENSQTIKDDIWLLFYFRFNI